MFRDPLGINKYYSVKVNYSTVTIVESWSQFLCDYCIKWSSLEHHKIFYEVLSETLERVPASKLVVKREGSLLRTRKSLTYVDGFFCGLDTEALKKKEVIFYQFEDKKFVTRFYHLGLLNHLNPSWTIPPSYAWIVDGMSRVLERLGRSGYETDLCQKIEEGGFRTLEFEPVKFHAKLNRRSPLLTASTGEEHLALAEFLFSKWLYRGRPTEETVVTRTFIDWRNSTEILPEGVTGGLMSAEQTGRRIENHILLYELGECISTKDVEVFAPFINQLALSSRYARNRYMPDDEIIGRPH
jgi:hypothetical protein